MRRLSLICLVLLVGWALQGDRGVFLGNAAQAGAQVRLTAMSVKSAYQDGEPIEITLTLENTGTVPVNLSDRGTGTLQVASLTRDGAPVPTRSSVVNFLEDLGYTLEQSLKAVAPGQRLQLVWRSERDHVLGQQALDTVEFQTEDFHHITFYGVQTPGKYELAAVYQFPSQAAPGAQPYLGPTEPAVVAFEVLP